MALGLRDCEFKPQLRQTAHSNVKTLCLGIMLCGLETTTYYYHHYDPGSFVERQILFINTFPCLFGLAISQYAVYPVATFTFKKCVFTSVTMDNV